MAGFVSIVGAGPGDPELLTLAGRRRLASGEVIVADYLVNPAVLLHCRSDAVIYQRMAGPRHGALLDQKKINNLLVRHALAGRHVVRLKGGDPCMFGRGAEEAQILAERGISFEFVPGVTSPVAAPEAAGIPVTHRDFTPAVTFVSGFEAYEKAGLEVAWAHLARSAGTLVFLMGVKNVRANLERLVAAGRAADTPAAVVRWGTRGIQQTLVGSVGDLADGIERAGVRPPAIIVVGDVVHLRRHIAWADRRPLFGRRIVVTRAFEDGDPLVTLLRDKGADVVQIPTVRTVPVGDQALADIVQALNTIDGFDGVVLSSRRGVEELFHILERHGLDVRRLAGRLLAVIGPSTEARCRAFGLVPDLVASPPRSEGLVQVLAATGNLGRRWLHLRSARGRDLLEQAIKDEGGDYRVAAVYDLERPVPHDGAVRSLLSIADGGEGVDWLVFTSGAAAENLRVSLTEIVGPEGLRQIQERAEAVVLGPATATAAERAGFRVAAIASEPSDPALLDAVLQRAAQATGAES